MIEKPETLGLVYLATPYSKHPRGIDAAFIEAAKLTGLLIRTGMTVYSPIAHTHVVAVQGGIDPFDHSIWLPFDMAMMNAADTLIVAHMDGWESSFGIAEEVKVFARANKPIYDLDPATLFMERRNYQSKPREDLIGHLAHGKTRREQGGASV